MRVTQYQDDVHKVGGLGRKAKKKHKRQQKQESSLPVLACPFSPSQKHHNIRTAPASSGFLLLPQYPRCLRLSWTPVKRAIGDRALRSLIFSCAFWSLFPPFPKQQPQQQVGVTLHRHSVQALQEFPAGPCTAGEPVLPLCYAHPPREQPSGSSGDQTK